MSIKTDYFKVIITIALILICYQDKQVKLPVRQYTCYGMLCLCPIKLFLLRRTSIQAHKKLCNVFVTDTKCVQIILRAGVTNYNKGSIEFENGSRIVSATTTGNTGRGMSISLLYCDEFAFVQPNVAKTFGLLYLLH